MADTRALVWFKRDLRQHDHAPLVAAQAHGDALAVFVIEPAWLQSPECDAIHVDFALGCLAELRAALARRGLPLLARVPLPYLAEPWKMDASVQRMAGCVIGVDYPTPVVDNQLAMKAAKDRMYSLRQSSPAREEASAIQAHHGSRKSGLPPSGQRRNAARAGAVKLAPAPSPQGDLFG